MWVSCQWEGGRHAEIYAESMTCFANFPQSDPGSFFWCFTQVAVRARALVVVVKFAFLRPLRDQSSFSTLVEVCSGIGGISEGARFAGLETLLSVDKAEIACKTVSLNGGRAIQGDIGTWEVQMQILAACKDRGHMLAASLPGDMLPRTQAEGEEVHDKVLQMLTWVLHVAWRSQASGVILECMPEIQQHKTAMALLDQFAMRMCLQVQHICLDLSDQWVAKRRRWWCVLLPCDLPSFQLSVWPLTIEKPVISDVLEEWPQWPLEQERALAWSETESSLYSDPAYGSESRSLDWQAQAPAAMHSWGSALQPCPCGCRSAAFPDQTLRAKGLKGFGVFSEVLQGFRFPHAAEVGFLNSLPASFKHLPEARAALCLAGQMTAPLQALWVIAQIRTWSQQTFTGTCTTDAYQLLLAFKDLLLESRKDFWLTPSLQHAFSIWLRADAEPWELRVPGPTQVRQLIQAEKQLHGPGLLVRVFDNGRRMHDLAYLHPTDKTNPYQLVLQRKAASRTVTSEPRLSELGTSDVVIWAGLLRIQAAFSKPAFVLPPALAVEWLAVDFTGPLPFKWPKDCKLCLLPFVCEDHWSLLVLSQELDAKLEAKLYDGVPGHSFEAAQRLTDRVCEACQLPHRCVQSLPVQVQQKSGLCGPMVLAYAASVFAGAHVSFEDLLRDAMHFCRFMPLHSASLYGFGGLSESQMEALRKMLADRGVPDDALNDRIHGALSKLGPGPIAKALQADNQWQALKAAGSAPNPLFRWIRPEELQAFAQNKANQKFGTAIGNAKARKQKHARASKPALHVDPTSLLLSAGSFVSAQNTPLAQLSFDEVVSQAQGVAFCTVQQMMPFITGYKALSVDALALVSTAPLPPEACAGAPVTNVRFPALFAPTQEAVLLSGSLLQLGDEHVQLSPADADMGELEQLDTITGRLSLYRDEAQLDWAVFAKAPIRTLLQHVPGLSLCKDKSCKGDCPAFHAAVDEQVEQMLLDVWSRQFCKVEGGRAAPEAAGLFQALVRVPCSAAKHLQRIAVTGFYFEPRAQQGFGPHPAYAVVWLPGFDKNQALHALRTCDKALGLARLGIKFGLRVQDEHEQAVFELLRPHQAFIKVRVLTRWRLHPLPHGTQRHTLVLLLSKWKWAAKPLQPCKGDSTGCAWEVGSESEPPANVMQLGEGFVLIHKLRDITQPAKPEVLCASSRTRRRILYDDPEAPASSTDPWAGGRDPWSLARPPPGLPAPSAATSSAVPTPAAESKLSQVKTELQAGIATLVRKELQSAIHSASPDPGQDARILKLEAGLNEASQVVEVQQAVAAQQTDLGEATNPGPEPCISFGTSNPSGLRNKEQLAAELGPGVWQFSETQLSAISFPASARAIRASTRALHRDVRIFAGAPAPLRPGSQFAGSWTGVLTMSDFPSRPVQLQWLHDSFHTGRIQALHHFICDTPVLTTNVYGYPPGKTFVDARARTEHLLETLTHELVLGRKGVRLICGDFNHWHDHLEQVQLWKQQGWIEAQDLAQLRWQQVPTPTCKGSTQRDFIFLSPEAAALCESVRVCEIFAEHATVIAGLRLTGVRRILAWPLPAEIPWQAVDVPAWHQACSEIQIDESCSTRWLHSFARGFEGSLQGFVTAVPGHQLPKRCHGRAGRLSPDTPPSVHPPSPARPGEEAAHHDLLSLEVKRWYQQLRRLQSLDHALQAGNQSPSAVEHRLGLWRSILKAKGFKPDFGLWWPSRPVRLVGSPLHFPLAIPGASMCHLLFLDFRDNYRRFEAWNARQRRAILAEKYTHNRNLLFRDLRDPKPEQVDTLELRKSYAILAVDTSTCQAHLDKDIDQRGCSHWHLDGCPVQVTSVLGDVCCIPDCSEMHAEAELEQTIVLSSAEHVQSEFEKLWSSFWKRFACPNDQDWSRIAQFVRAFLPQGHLELPRITLQQWRAALKRFKPRAARGADGFAAADLLNMSDAHTLQLLGFLRGIEDGSREWPEQWLTGLVCCLKKPNARLDPHGYRPICILSCVYRTWSGIRARQVLRWLSGRMPDTALGFLPHRETAQFWWLLEAQIELACQCDLPLVGYCTDVVKAFNVLPRQPVFDVAEWIGLPLSLIKPWQSFLGRLERRFLIRQSVGTPLRSTCGFPEGCGLSTVGMSVVCLCYHAYVTTFASAAVPHSYVDNLACCASSTGQLASGINVSNTFFDMWNAAMVQRCLDLGPLFGRLRRSPAALFDKLKTLPVKFWAQALHGASGCPLADTTLSSLRAQAVRALKCAPAGTSAMLRLSIVEPLDADPGFYQLWSSIRDIRRLAAKDSRVLELWAEYMLHFSGQLFQGPFSKLLQVLGQIGWWIDTPPFVVDHDGITHDLLAAPQGSLRQQCEQGWLHYVATQHQHRQTMRDLDGIDLSLIRADNNRLSPLDLARVSALRSGAFMFGACHAKYDASKDGLCPLCRVPDDHEHRVCKCPRFKDARGPYTWVCELWPTLPSCLRVHLLPPRNPHLPNLRHGLASVPDRSADFVYADGDLTVQHVPSHMNPELSLSPFEDWVIFWNSHVDTAAGVANQNRPWALKQAHERAYNWHRSMLEVIRALRGIYMGIAATTQPAGRPEGTEIDTVDTEIALQEPVLHDGPTLEDALPVNWRLLALQACPQLPAQFVDALCDFLVDPRHVDAPWRRISWLELVFVFRHLGKPFPVRSLTTDRWLNAAEVPLGAPSLTVAVQLSLMRRALRCIFRAIRREDLVVDSISLVDLGVTFYMEGARSVQLVTWQDCDQTLTGHSLAVLHLLSPGVQAVCAIP
ncbi:unnamed protein product [Symbiodinium microadriaticum]|nr:unnamed protein product [Symbiodinium microadriaticum]CAE7927681.1 unnamed protein product [Symbiodinium sp. KB8]